MTQFFDDMPAIVFEGLESTNHLAYRYYNPQQKVLGKTMEEHLRLSVCFWQTFCWPGNNDEYHRPWQHHDAMHAAELRVKAAFEFIEKLGLRFFTFHDRDIAPTGNTLRETNKNLLHIAEKIAIEMEQKHISLLWGTANLFSHRRYLAGAATNPDPDVFAYAVAQVKQALDITHRLRGENYVLWGGRDGYDTLLNTNLTQELQQLARFLTMLVEYKHKIGYKGTLLIAPKPCEPTKHPYDYDTATVSAFLQQHGLEKEFKVNIEANHASLAGHSFSHEVAYAFAHNLFGSIDSNQGDTSSDVDTLSTHLNEMVQVLYLLLCHGGFQSGGFNLNTKLRRQSIDLSDMFFGHLSGIDALARSLLVAAKLVETKSLETFLQKRYAPWQQPLGQEILQGKTDFSQIASHVLDNEVSPQPTSGRQEMLEILVNAALR